MAVEAIGSAAQSGVTSRAAINQEDFLKVLLAQLQFQDPLKPLDNNEFIAQFAQMTSLEQTQQLNKKLDTVLSFQNSSLATGLLGRSVEAQTETGTAVGEVTSVAYEQGLPSLTIKNSQDEFITGISLGQISIVQ